MSAVSLTLAASRAVAALDERQREIVDEHLRDFDVALGPVDRSDLIELFEERADESRDEPALSRELEAIASNLALPDPAAYR